MRSIPLVLLVFVLGCGAATSPVQPTTPVPFSLSGLVQDTAFRPLSGARVEITQGFTGGRICDDG